MLVGHPLPLLGQRPFPERPPEDAPGRPERLVGVKDELPFGVEADRAGGADGVADLLPGDARPRLLEELDGPVHLDFSSTRLREESQPPPQGQTLENMGPGQAKQFLERYRGRIVDRRRIRFRARSRGARGGGVPQVTMNLELEVIPFGALVLVPDQLELVLPVLPQATQRRPRLPEGGNGSHHAQIREAFGDLLEGHGRPALHDDEADEISNREGLRVDALEDVRRYGVVRLHHAL